MAVKQGDVFGFMTAVRPTYKTLSSGRKMHSWFMRCACGNEIIAMSVNIIKGKHKSCGCHLQKAVLHETMAKNAPQECQKRLGKKRLQKPLYQECRNTGFIGRCWIGAIWKPHQISLGMARKVSRYAIDGDLVTTG